MRYLRMFALSRLYLDNFPNLQVSWATQGPKVGQVALRFGGNDFGGDDRGERRLAGGRDLQAAAAEIERYIRAAGFVPRRRNMRYESVAGGRVGGVQAGAPMRRRQRALGDPPACVRRARLPGSSPMGRLALRSTRRADARERGTIRAVGRPRRARGRAFPTSPNSARRRRAAPGLVNAHCHLELSHLAGRCRGPSSCLGRGAVQERAGSSRTRSERGGAASGGATLAAGEPSRSGTSSNALAHLDLLQDAGLRAVVFFELLGWDPARAGAVMEAAEARLAAQAAGLNGRVGVKLAAHAPHSVSAELFQMLRARGGPASVHLAESAAEASFLAVGGGSGAPSWSAAASAPWRSSLRA